MLRLIHPILALVLIVSHALFLFRGLKMRREGGTPQRFDRIVRNLSHLGLPLTIISGFLSRHLYDAADTGPSSLTIVHMLMGLAPLAVIFLFAPFLSLKRRIPWLLPSLVLVLLLLNSIVGAVMLLVLD